MIHNLKYLLFTFFLLASLYSEASIDSLGIKTIDGKKYILHKLEAKETLYSLARRYHVSVSEITASNESEKDGLNIDQIGRVLKIPFKPEAFKSSGKVETPKQKTSDSDKHTILAGETLYSLSRKYGVSTEKLKEWNDLVTNELSIGMEIWIVDPNDNKGTVAVLMTKKEVKEKNTVEHIVDFGETVYSISKKYDVPQKDILAWNRLDNTDISVGQKLVIKTKVKEEKISKENSYTSSVQTFHNAKQGESYRDVANIYSLKASDLRKWNNFNSPFKGGEVIRIIEPEKKEDKNEQADQQKEIASENDDNLHIVASGETIFSLADKYDVNMEDLRKWNSMDNYQVNVGQRLYIRNPDSMEAISQNNTDDYSEAKEEEEEVTNHPVVSENVQKQDTKAYFTVEPEDVPKIEKVTQTGIAEVIAGSDGTEKYLALHRTAKIGTIMQVRNDLNDQIVFVRVLGKLPNTGVDDKVIIRISKKAFEKLGGVDYKFPVEISYLPLKD